MTVADWVPVAVFMEIRPVQVVPAVNPDGLTETVKLVFEALAVKLPVGEMVSQVVLVQLCSEVWAIALVLVWAVTVRVCGTGATPPATALNVRAEELKVRPEVFGAVTFRVTVADWVLVPTVMEIVPVHVVFAVSPDGLTETVKLVFDVPATKLPVGERVSQLLDLQLVSDTCAFALVLVWAVTVSVCEGGAAPPAAAVNVKVVELRVRGGVTVRVTLKTSDPELEFI